MSKFTSGKWHIDPLTGEIHTNEGRVAKVYGATEFNREKNASECQANARLILKAPEMYRLLSYFSTLEDVTNDEFYNFYMAVNETRKLLARIEGDAK